MLQLLPSQKPEPNPEVITKLEELLEDARKGEIDAVLVFASYEDSIRSCPVGPFDLAQLSFSMKRLDAALLSASFSDEEE